MVFVLSEKKIQSEDHSLKNKSHQLFFPSFTANTSWKTKYIYISFHSQTFSLFIQLKKLNWNNLNIIVL